MKTHPFIKALVQTHCKHIANDIIQGMIVCRKCKAKRQDPLSGEAPR